MALEDIEGSPGSELGLVFGMLDMTGSLATSWESWTPFRTLGSPSPKGFGQCQPRSATEVTISDAPYPYVTLATTLEGPVVGTCTLVAMPSGQWQGDYWERSCFGSFGVPESQNLEETLWTHQALSERFALPRYAQAREASL